MRRKRVREFGKKHADAEIELRTWFAIAKKSEWKDLSDVRVNFADADQAGKVLIFPIRHKLYRLIAKVDYRSKLLMVKQLLTHREYERGGWKKWC